MDFRGSEDFSVAAFKSVIIRALIKVFILGFLLGGFICGSIYEKQQDIQCKGSNQQIKKLS